MGACRKKKGVSQYLRRPGNSLYGAGVAVEEIKVMGVPWRSSGEDSGSHCRGPVLDPWSGN